MEVSMKRLMIFLSLFAISSYLSGFGGVASASEFEKMISQDTATSAVEAVEAVAKLSNSFSGSITLTPNIGETETQACSTCHEVGENVTEVRTGYGGPEPEVYKYKIADTLNMGNDGTPFYASG
jgi:hypothetical protein